MARVDGGECAAGELPNYSAFDLRMLEVPHERTASASPSMKGSPTT
jgi:hypothetical protein